MTSACDDILRPLNDEEFIELLELYKHKYESNEFQYLLLLTHYEWNKQLQELNIDQENTDWIGFRKIFYTHRDKNFRKYGTYVCLHQDLIQSVAFHSWQPNGKELLECLNQTNLIKWKDGPLLVNVANEYSEAVKKIALAKGTIPNARQCQGLILNKDHALQLNIPTLPVGFKVTELQQHDAEQIYSFWVNKKEASLDYIKGFIKLRKCLGIAEEATGNLVAWIFQNEFSGLAILQVIPSVQRRGLGKYLAVSMSKIIAESSSVHPSAWVVLGNVKSESLFKSIGYKRHVFSEWIQINKIS